MEVPQSFVAVYALLQAGLIAPLVQWLKRKLPGDFPVQPVVYTAVLSFCTAWVLAQWLAQGISIETLITYALGGHLVSQLTHASAKSIRKVVTK